ncbi:MAG: fibronectin type III domain-containing protein [Planctomycetota bacterium]|nr:fibronectin type III domain-containing protein [Planctomycetota bacterium]
MRFTAKFPLVLLLFLTLASNHSVAQVPGLLVEPYLQSPTPSSMVIGWETQGNSQSQVQYGLTSALGQLASGTSVDSGGGAFIHHVDLAGLQAQTRYYYRVVSGSIISPVYFFSTPPALTAETPFQFIAYSDAQNGSNGVKHEEVINDGVISFCAQEYGIPIDQSVSFSLVPGDLVSTGTTHSHWQDHFFGQAQNLYRHVPLIPALGNHEIDAQYYFDYMQLPNNGTPGFEEHWHYLDHQNVRVITLDTNSGYRIQEQLDWLSAVLDDAAVDDRIDFVFAQFHHPHKSEIWTPGETFYSTQIITAMEQFSTVTGKPSIHFFGHTHGYSRGQSRDHNHSMVNVASAMGSLDYWGLYPNADYEEFEFSVPEWGFVLMDVEAGPDPAFRLRRISRGNDYIFRDNEVIDEIFVRRYNTPPDTPVPLTPGPGSGVIPGDDVILTGSPFFDLEGDAHIESQWQVTTTPGNYTNPVVDEWRRFQNWYRSPAVDPGISIDTVLDPDMSHVCLETPLPGCTTVYWRVRYRDRSLGWSDWSTESSFEVGNSSAGPMAPFPGDGDQQVTFTPILEWFPCDPADSYDVYLGQNPVLGAGDFAGNQLATSYDPGPLDVLTAYYWRIDYRVGAAVIPGPTWSFTTDQDYPTEFTSEWRFGDAAPADDVDLEPSLGPSTLTPRGMIAGAEWGTGTSDGIEVPHINGEPVDYIWLDNVYGSGRGLENFFNAPGNGGGGCCDVFHFTLIFDVFLDTSQTGLQALWQGNANNSNDAEFFMRCGDGALWSAGDGYFAPGSWNLGEWVRIVDRVDYQNNTSAVFVNGVKVMGDDQLSAPDWLYALGSGSPVWMISDNGPDSDVSLVRCGAVAIVDGLMGDDAIAALGGPDAAGIFVDDPVELFVRADANGGGGIDISDAVGMLTYQFGGGTTDCLDALDANDDGSIDISDPVYLLTFLFSGGGDPPAPFPLCGEDPTADLLDCVNQAACP